MFRFLPFLFLPFWLFGQQKTTRYFDEAWKPTDKENAAYYRKIQYNAHGRPIGITRDYYLSGEKQWEGKVLSENPDVNDSLCVWYHKNGKVLQKSFYVKGKLEGEMTVYFESGKLQEQRLYRNGLREGLSKAYHEGGKLAAEVPYVADQPHGAAVYYHENGTLREKTLYVNGKKEGESLHYYGNGQLEGRHHYVHDTLDGSSTRYSPQGDTLANGRYLKGKETGTWVTYYAKGQVSQVCVYEPEQHRKQCTRYHENGFKAQEEHMEGGLQAIQIWFRNGTLSTQTHLANQKLQGQQLEYYPNGQLKTDYQYENGQRVGTSKSYYPNGQLYALEVFQKEGKLLSRKTYYPNGQPETIEGYDARGLQKTLAQFDENGQPKASLQAASDSATSVASAAPNTSVEFRLAKDNAACLYGFKDQEDQWIIAPQFTAAYDNENGYLVRKGEKWGLVSEAKIVIPVEYDGLSVLQEPVWRGYSKRYMKANKGALYGIIDLHNKPHTAFDYEEVRLGLHNTFLLKKNGIFWIQDAQGHLTATPMRHLHHLSEAYIQFLQMEAHFNRFGLVNWQGKLLLPPQFQELKEVVAHVFEARTRNGKLGLFHLSGKWLADTVYTQITVLSPQLFRLDKDGQSGLLHVNGQWLVPMGTQQLNYEVHGPYLLKKGEKAQLLHTDLRPVLSRSWDALRLYKSTTYAFNKPFPDLWLLVKEKGSYQVLDTLGKNVLPGTYQDAALVNDGAILVVDNGRKLLFYHGEYGQLVEKSLDEMQLTTHQLALTNGQVVIDAQGNVLFRSQNNIVPLDGESGYFTHNEKGQTILYLDGKPPRTFSEHWENIRQLDEQHWAVMNDSGKWGVLDEQLRLAIPALYDALGCYEPALKGVWAKKEVTKPEDADDSGGELEEAWGVATPSGMYALPNHYYLPAPFNKEGMAVLTRDGKSGIVNTKGEIVLPFEYDLLFPWSSSLYLLQKDGKYGAASTKGTLLFPLAWDQVTTFQGKHALFYQDEQQGILDTNGHVVMPLKEASFVRTNVNIGNYFTLSNYTQQPTEWKVVIPGYEKIAQYKAVKLRRAISNLLISETLEGARLENTYLPPLLATPCAIQYKEPYDLYQQFGYGETIDIGVELLTAQQQSFAYQVTTTRSGRGYSRSEYAIRNYAIKGDSIATISLQDLFLPYSHYMPLLNRLLAQEIRKLDNPAIDCSNPSELVERYQNMWYITPKGLTFLLSDEQGSYEERLLIRYKDLSSLLHPKGPLQEFSKTVQVK